ncbi:PAS domain S-box protein [Tropicibacter oceani]|uniref:histidine kinase n=1 Tax=Tropicibacter oceani TaxID=3058420 RepID=A0ABY8QFQ2_9RHOB|nr:PAS domain S-box protein [Tropicibacter oceani]WGW02838.1 PAS domain S-box protein [Tropicibacter oceani]
MAKTGEEGNQRLNEILRDVVTKREFSALDFDECLLYFCKLLSQSLGVRRVGIWELSTDKSRLSVLVQWDSEAGLLRDTATLNADAAQAYFDAINENCVLPIRDTLNDPRCAGLVPDYLVRTGVRAMLDCPVRTYTGLTGIVCIETVEGPRDWTEAERNFAFAISDLVALSIEHWGRVISEQAAGTHEQRLKVYTELATDWLWETDTDLRFQFLEGNQANDGQMPKDYIGKRLWEVPVLTPLHGDWESLKSRMAQHKRVTGFVVGADLAGDGIHYAEISGLPKFDEQGRYVGYYGTARDVTQRVRQSLALSESEQKFKHASHIARLGHWTWDEVNDRCTYCSSELEEIYGVSVEELLRRTASHQDRLAWVHSDDRDRFDQVLKTARQTKAGYEMTMRIVRDDGTERTLHHHAEPVLNAQGDLVATHGVLLDITENARIQAQLQLQQGRLTSIIDHLPGAVYRVKWDAVFSNIYRSRGYLRHFVDPALGGDDWALQGDLPGLEMDSADRARIEALLRDAVARDVPYEVEYPITLRDGSTKWVFDRGRPVRMDNGEVELEGIMLDITDRHAAEEALAHGQRLEAIGKLTGGIAHDFNNLLAVILGNLELLRGDLDKPTLIELIDAGIEAVHRGADLNKNMLAFARKSRLTMEVLDLNDVARKSKNWIGRTLPENIDVETSLLAGLWPIEADISSTESAILNLVLNARDAMPQGGRLTIETSNVRIDEHYVQSRHEDLAPGRYVMLAVSDTGHGIPDEVRAHIFEPFYTTKPQGMGSGLGLSMILGFMKQSGGTVRVYSEPGVGTTFKLYFKALSRGAQVETARARDTGIVGQGSAEILVVEDEHGVLQVLDTMLTKVGYTVHTARSGDEAYAMFQEGLHFDLLLTDIVMPGEKQGTTLAKALRAHRPDLPVVFMSGYANEATVHGNGLLPEDIRLMKPVSRSDLIMAIEKALGQGGSRSDTP